VDVDTRVHSPEAVAHGEGVDAGFKKDPCGDIHRGAARGDLWDHRNCECLLQLPQDPFELLREADEDRIHVQLYSVCARLLKCQAVADPVGHFLIFADDPHLVLLHHVGDDRDVELRLGCPDQLKTHIEPHVRVASEHEAVREQVGGQMVDPILMLVHRRIRGTLDQFCRHRRRAGVFQALELVDVITKRRRPDDDRVLQLQTSPLNTKICHCRLLQLQLLRPLSDE
jgi:hypothetical protein